MKKYVRRTIGVLALFLSLAAFYLGSAPFTPAVLLTAVSAPLAIIAIIVRAWRLGALALYFSIFALLTSPALVVGPFKSDNFFFGVAIVGLAIAVALWSSWRHSAKVT